MPTDEMLITRFEEIFNLTSMSDSDIEDMYGLNPGLVDINAYRRGVIASICRITMAELMARNGNELKRPERDINVPEL
jgi:hypothetical protein